MTALKIAALKTVPEKPAGMLNSEWTKYLATLDTKTGPVVATLEPISHEYTGPTSKTPFAADVYESLTLGISGLDTDRRTTDQRFAYPESKGMTYDPEYAAAGGYTLVLERDGVVQTIDFQTTTPAERKLILGTPKRKRSTKRHKPHTAPVAVAAVEPIIESPAPIVERPTAIVQTPRCECGKPADTGIYCASCAAFLSDDPGIIDRSSDTLAVTTWCSNHKLPAYVVGRWVWIQWNEKPDADTLAMVKEAGFRWVHKRHAWAHCCGIPSRKGSHDPRAKYGMIPVEEVA